VVQGLSAAEQETLRKLLRKVIGSLDAHASEGGVQLPAKRKVVRA